MKLEMDLIRGILLWCNGNLPSDNPISASEIVIPGYKADQITFHFKLLVDGGYINAIDMRTMTQPFDYMPIHLTLSGYEFYESIKNDTIWNGMKEEAGKIGIQVIKLAIPILAQLLTKQLGLN